MPPVHYVVLCSGKIESDWTCHVHFLSSERFNRNTQCLSPFYADPFLRLEPNKHYTVVNDLTCLHLRSCWEIYLEHRRRVGKGEPAGGLRAIRRMLKENLDRDGYVKELDKTATLGTGRPRTVAIDLKQAGEFLDVDLFPIENARPWYGVQDYVENAGENVEY
jgi:hypothetical protein